MISPPFLKENDEIAVVATAKRVDIQDLQIPIQILKSWGLKVRVGKNIYSTDNLLAGTDRERAEDLQEAIDDPLIKGIFCARGGYGTNRIIDNIKFDSLLSSPKWIIGFSDITIMLNHLNKLNLETLHGLMPILFAKEEYQDSLYKLKEVLFGAPLRYTIPGTQFNIPGEAEGVLIGGNLTILHTLLGTRSFFDFNNKILFIEEVGEYLYHLDRMIIHFKRTGLLKNLKGIVVGHFSDIKDGDIPFGKSVINIIREAVKEYNYPVSFGFPSGHQSPNMPLIFGRKIQMKVDLEEVSLIFAPSGNLNL